MVRFEAVFETMGDGYWSNQARAVQCTKIAVPYVNDEADFGELRVYFDTDTWDVEEHGLIYTDSLFITMLREKLSEIGFEGSDVEYSEQGMQGDNYVSLDVGEKFLRSWLDIVTV
jgi:hypothetical protein